MAKENKILKDRAKPLGNYPHIIKVGDWVFVSGTSSRKPDNTHKGAYIGQDGSVLLDIKEQTEAVIENIGIALNSVGYSLDDLVEITTFLVDMNHFKGYNEVYGNYFDAETGPTRTTVAVKQLPHPHLLIEMQAKAYRRK